jgi:hypothetical protein
MSDRAAAHVLRVAVRSPLMRADALAAPPDTKLRPTALPGRLLVPTHD